MYLINTAFQTRSGLRFAALACRVVTCDVIDSSYLHSVRSPQPGRRGTGRVRQQRPERWRTEVLDFCTGSTSRQVSPVGNPAPPITQSRSCAFLPNMVGQAAH